MLKRNFLRCVLLFIGLVNIKRVVADKVLGECDGTTGFELLSTCSSPTSFCYSSSTKKIHAIEGSAAAITCKDTALTVGVHYFVYTSDTATREIGSTEAILASDAANLIMYICNANSECEQTIGLAKIKIYVNSDVGSEPFGEAADKTAYCKLANNVCTVYASNATFDTNAHAVTSTVYKIEKSGGTTASGGSACTTGSIGLFDDNNKLCVGEATAKIADFATGTFILTGNLAGSSIFKSLVSAEDGSTGILITATNNEVYHNNLKSAVKPMVFHTDTMMEQPINSDINTHATKLLLFECVDGSCTRTGGFIKDGASTPNYYELNASAASKILTSSDYVADCSTAGNVGKLIIGTNELCTRINEKITYPTSASYDIIYIGAAFNFIRTINGIISIRAMTGIAGSVNAINVMTATKITSFDTNDNLLTAAGDNIKNIAFFYCEVNKLHICRKTSGYLKTSDSNYYAIYMDTINNAENTAVATCATATAGTDFGSMDSSGKICLGNTNQKTFGTDNGDYLFKEATINSSKPIANDASSGVVVNISANFIVRNEIYYFSETAGLHLIEILSNTKQLNEVDYANAGTVDASIDGLYLYNCDGNNICEKTCGYVRPNQGSNYYYIKYDGSSGLVSATNAKAATCATTYGDIDTSTGKLCIGNDIGIPFPTTGTTTSHILSLSEGNIFKEEISGNILIKGTKNALTIDSVSQKTIMVINSESASEQPLTDTAGIEDEAENLQLFECEGQNCIRTSGYVADGKSVPGPNYFSVTTEGSSLMSDTDYVTKCIPDNAGKLVTSTNELCIGGFKKKDYPDAAKNYILWNGSAFKFVRTADKIISISSISGTLTAGVNAINVKTATKISSIDTSTNLLTAVGGDIKNLALFYCDLNNYVCEQTSGYLKTSDKYYAIFETLTINAENTAVANCATATAGTDFGSMDASGKVCLGNANQKTFQTDNGNYLFKETTIAGSKPIIDDATSGVIVEISNNFIIRNEFYYDSLSDGLHLIEIDGTSKKFKDIDYKGSGTVTTEDGLSLYDCKGYQCTKTSGYVKVGTDYYTIPHTAASSKLASASLINVACGDDNDLGKVYTTGKKLCIGGNKDIPLATTDTTIDYYITLPSLANDFINDNTGVKIIVRSYKNALILNHVEDGFYIVSDNESTGLSSLSNSGYLIECTSFKCDSNISSLKTETYYLDATSVGLDDKYSKIIYCVDNIGTLVCTSQTPKEGYYLNAGNTGLTDSIVNCRGNPVKCEIKAATNGFSYIDEGHEDYIISCFATCSTAPGSKLQGHGYVDGTTITNPNVMITYDRESSKFKQTTLTLTSSGVHYVNALDPKQVTTCKTVGGCTSENASAAFYDDNTDLDQNHILTCTTAGCISSIALTRCKDKTPSAYCKYDDGSSGINLPVGRFCIHTDEKIYKSIDGPTGDCKDQATEGTFLFKANGDFYDSITLDTSYTGNDSGLIYECGASGANCKQVISSSIVVGDNKYMYSCDKDGLCSKKTSVNPGYYLVGPPSVVTTKSYLSYGKLLKCTNTLLSICTSYASVTSNDNYIDAASPDNIITCPGTTSCYFSAHGASSTEPKYYVNGENKLNIITCNGSGCTSSPGSQLQGHAYISGTDLSKKTMIKYNGSNSFITEVIAAEKYYIDGSNPKQMITCTTGGGCFSGTPSIPSGSSVLFKTDATESSNHKITCSGEGCISAKIITECAKVVEGKCYTIYTSPSSKTALASSKHCIYTDGKIYKSTNSDGTCIAQEDTLLLKDDSGFVADTLDTGTGVIYSCISGTCVQIISSHYLDSTNNKLYSCDKDGTCSKVTTIGLGHYVLGVPTISSTAPFHTYSELLKCTGNNLDNCEKMTSITDGYFIDNSLSTPTNVIACASKSKSCSIQAGSQDSGYAYIDANDSSHQSLIIYNSKLVSIFGSQLPGHAYIDASDPSNKFVITCTEYGCTSEDVIKNLAADKKMYFINGDKSKTSLITCEKNTGKCTTRNIDNGLYTDGIDNTRVILCNTNKGCISTKSIVKCAAVDSGAKCKYDNNGASTDLDVDHYCINSNGNIYKTATASSCTPVDSGSHIIKSDGTGKKLDTLYTDSDAGIIYTCASSVCIPLVSSHFLGPNVSTANNKPTYMYGCDVNGQCTKMSSITKGNYITGIPTITDGISYFKYSSLVQCTENDISSCAALTVSAALDTYYIDTNNNLIKCNTSVCERIDYPAHGYYINTGDTTTNKYIQCSGNGCKAIQEPTTDCTASTVGQLIKDGSDFKLCLRYGANAIKSTKIDIGSASEYLVNYHSSSIFKSYVSKTEYFGIVKVTGVSSIVLDNTNVVTIHCYSDTDLTSTSVQAGDTCSAGSSKYICNTDGVCIKETVGDVTNKVAPPTIPRIKKEKEEEEDTGASNLKIECEVLNKGKNCKENTYYLVNKNNHYSLAEDEGSLFYCETEGNDCTEIFDIGYYVIDKKTIYSCKEGQDGGIECTKSEVTESENACNASTLGKIFLNQDKLSICFEYVSGGTPKEYSIELNVSNSGNYIIHKDATNLFGLSSQQDYAIVSVKDRIITINKNYNNKLKYVYANKSSKMKLIEKGDTCPPKTGGGFDNDNIMELNCTEGKCKEVSANP